MKNDTATGRREWLRTTARLSLGAVLGGGIASLVLRNQGLCGGIKLCHACRSFSDCSLPNAAVLRQMMDGERGHVE